MEEKVDNGSFNESLLVACSACIFPGFTFSAAKRKHLIPTSSTTYRPQSWFSAGWAPESVSCYVLSIESATVYSLPIHFSNNIRHLLACVVRPSLKSVSYSIHHI